MTETNYLFNNFHPSSKQFHNHFNCNRSALILKFQTHTTSASSAKIGPKIANWIEFPIQLRHIISNRTRCRESDSDSRCSEHTESGAKVDASKQSVTTLRSALSINQYALLFVNKKRTPFPLLLATFDRWVGGSTHSISLACTHTHIQTASYELWCADANRLLILKFSVHCFKLPPSPRYSPRVTHLIQYISICEMKLEFWENNSTVFYVVVRNGTGMYFRQVTTREGGDLGEVGGGH